MRRIAIAVDGPAGAGKSTIAGKIADKLGILYMDTGAMYRAVTLYIIRNGLDINDFDGIRKLIEDMDINICDNSIYLNGEDVSNEIRLQDVNNLVSPVSAIPFIREKLVILQRKIACNKSVIMDGRDIGTNVLKDADIKIYLTASVEERAERRYNELKKKGVNVNYEVIKQGIIERDRIDSTRETDPLKIADDALVIDTTGKSIEDVSIEILDLIKKRWENAV